MEPTDLSITELAVLGVLAERETHGFAISKELAAEGPLGRILTVRRPSVYRALDRLVAAGMARPIGTEKGDSGPDRVLLRATEHGRSRLHSWLETPVEHVRDMRIELLLKLELVSRSGGSPLPLLRAQSAALRDTLGALGAPAPDHPVELWRHHNALAAGAFLEELEELHS